MSAPGAWQSPGVCRQVGGRGCGRNKEKRKAGGGEEGGGSLQGRNLPQPQRKKERARTKPTGTEGGGQIEQGREENLIVIKPKCFWGKGTLQMWQEKVIYALNSTRRRVRSEVKVTGVAGDGGHTAEAT